METPQEDSKELRSHPKNPYRLMGMRLIWTNRHAVHTCILGLPGKLIKVSDSIMCYILPLQCSCGYYGHSNRCMHKEQHELIIIRDHVINERLVLANDGDLYCNDGKFYYLEYNIINKLRNPYANAISVHSLFHGKCTEKIRSGRHAIRNTSVVDLDDIYFMIRYDSNGLTNAVLFNDDGYVCAKYFDKAVIDTRNTEVWIIQDDVDGDSRYYIWRSDKSYTAVGFKYWVNAHTAWEKCLKGNSLVTFEYPVLGRDRNLPVRYMRVPLIPSITGP